MTVDPWSPSPADTGEDNSVSGALLPVFMPRRWCPKSRFTRGSKEGGLVIDTPLNRRGLYCPSGQSYKLYVVCVQRILAGITDLESKTPTEYRHGTSPKTYRRRCLDDTGPPHVRVCPWVHTTPLGRQGLTWDDKIGEAHEIPHLQV